MPTSAQPSPAPLSADRIAASTTGAHRQFYWAHGWGQNKSAFAGLAQSFQPFGSHLLFDFPGFGAAPPPPSAWTTADYADWSADVIAAEAAAHPRDEAPASPEHIWVGHSFGCRVGLQLAARHPDLIHQLCLIAGAGLQRQRSPLERAKLKARVASYKTLRRLAPVLGLDEDRLRARFGSADYRNAGAMRDTLINVVNEDLSDVATAVKCPVLLIYGANDTETPPEIGERLERLIPNAKLFVLDGQDHYSLLAGGRHQVARRLRDFLETA